MRSVALCAQINGQARFAVRVVPVAPRGALILTASAARSATQSRWSASHGLRHCYPKRAKGMAWFGYGRYVDVHVAANAWQP